MTIHLERLRRPGLPEKSALEFPRPVKTGPGGTAELKLKAGNPKPRGAIDGVVECIAYSPRTANARPAYAGTGLDPRLDVVVAHVRSEYRPPETPDWEQHIRPILAPYARLYPIMREHLIDLADPNAMRRWREPLLLALTRDIDDPNFMPVTRDLSEGKRTAIVRWLKQLPVVADSDPSVDVGHSTPAAPNAVDDARPSLDAKLAAAEAQGRRVTAHDPPPPVGGDER